MKNSFPPLNAERLWSRVEQLSRFTVPGEPWTRRAFSPLFQEARAWLQEQFSLAGMAVSVDAGGNLIGRLEHYRDGKPARRPIITGSHCDTVTMGGRFDGIIGVLAGIEIAQTLHESRRELNHPFEVIDFLSEEPSDYGISCVGSRAFSGLLSADMLQAKNPQGESLAQAISRIGGNPESLGQPLRSANSTKAFLELHIEQGPVLESKNTPIGVVTNIVGIRRVSIVVTGRPDHAGTTPMDIRQDALVGAARIIDAVSRLATEQTGKPHYVVATIGRLSLTPNASNAVPGSVEMTMEVRSDSDAVLDVFPETVMQRVLGELSALRVHASMTTVSRSKPTDCAENLMSAIEQAAAELHYPTMRLPSGAGHDAVYAAPTGPMGMIFIPCLNGRSHCPEESITPEQLLDGTRVLYQTILNIDADVA